eukprot:TRINITY_DN1448_c0_g1_i1.p2 TRINITY_DN1448_c0_g1~~TRINITY_DN1448_c0_g1_i1.p2  ORF type:complete len:262 (-),score=47.84 TRINITY_DN1448_c0_g1_i1:74-859(-)
MIRLALLAGLVLGLSAEVVVLTPENFDSIVLDSAKDVFVKFYAPWCGHCQSMAATWDTLGDEVTDVVIAKLDASAHRELGARFGIRGFPTLKFFSKSDKSGEVVYRGARDLASFKNFLDEHKTKGDVPVEAAAETVQETVAEAPKPVEVHDGVVVLTPDNFDSVALDSTKDVFVKFYAPWCGHCQRMVQTWNELAEAEKDRVVIAKVDADAHRDLGARFGVQGFPTLKLFKKGDKTGDVVYRGARDVASWHKFLNEQLASE